MKRIPIILSLATVAVATVTLVFFSPLSAVTLESEELPLPGISPSEIVPDLETPATVTVLLADETIRRPKVQFWDTARGKWKTLGRLRDDGKFGDPLAEDRAFTLQLQVYDSDGTTQLRVLGRQLKLKATVPTPVQLRVSAHKRGLRGVVVSGPSMINAWRTVQVGPDLTSGVTLSIPPSLVPKKSDEEVSFGDPSVASLPTDFTVSVSDVSPQYASLSSQDALVAVANDILTTDVTQIVAFHDGGIEVEATTLQPYHFFLYDAATNKAAHFMAGEDTFFSSQVFPQIIESVDF